MEILSREQAIAQGLKRYFTGRPCSRGHVAERRASNHSCLECHRENQTRLLREDPDYTARQRAAARRWKRSPAGRAAQRKYDSEKVRDPEKERARMRALVARKRATDIQYRVKTAVSRQIAYHVGKGGSSTSRLLLDRCGYTVAELMAHLEKQFTKGMHWGNYGRDGWHIDHIVPACSFDLTAASEFSACWSLGNLRPMWGLENSKKSAKNLFLI